MTKIIAIIRKIFKLPLYIITHPRELINKLKSFEYRKWAKETGKNAWHFFSFMLLLNVYLLIKGYGWLSKKRFFPKKISEVVEKPLMKFYEKVYTMNRYEEETINRVNLIELSFKNMRTKTSRTAITIGGMAVGIGAIVFLVSIGYGLQRLVIQRVARLEELKQIEVSTKVGSQVKITDATISRLNEAPGVEEVLPLISVVGRVSYQNSISDVAVYGVTTNYLKQSAIRPSKGKLFDSNKVANVVAGRPEVAGVKDIESKEEHGSLIREVEYEIEPGEWVRVREKPNTDAEILGYTKRVEGETTGEEYWGDSYISTGSEGRAGRDLEGKRLGKWVKSKVYLWEEVECDFDNPECIDGVYLQILEDGTPAQKEGYFAEINMKVTNKAKISQVLGVSQVLADEATASADTQESTASADTQVATESAEYIVDEDGFVTIATGAGLVEEEEIKRVNLGAEALKQAVVNKAMIALLGLGESEAIGKSFDVSFVVTSDLLQDANTNFESITETYEIVAVVPEEEAAYFYVPFTDLRSLGIANYSQLKVVTSNKDRVDSVRKQIEAMGLATSSVTDTVEQIDRLFATARLALASVGLVALSVAALGMFNTMSVSLLERTREVGLMKAMGMRSHEVRELFLTESMVMGFFGGVLGLLFGLIVGKLLGFLLSIFSIIQGVGYIDISHLPLGFSLFILFVSMLVGFVTGIYPARRATRISALNALRYE